MAQCTGPFLLLQSGAMSHGFPSAAQGFYGLSGCIPTLSTCAELQSCGQILPNGLRRLDVMLGPRERGAHERVPACTSQLALVCTIPAFMRVCSTRPGLHEKNPMLKLKCSVRIAVHVRSVSEPFPCLHTHRALLLCVHRCAWCKQTPAADVTIPSTGYEPTWLHQAVLKITWQ